MVERKSPKDGHQLYISRKYNFFQKSLWHLLLNLSIFLSSAIFVSAFVFGLLAQI